MKLTLEAESPEEVLEKGPEIVRRLEKALRPHAPGTADLLRKALEAEDDEHHAVSAGDADMKHAVLREGFALVHGEYVKMLEAMTKEIEDVVDAHLDRYLKEEA